ncbi:hypothetical protein WDU94_013007 [Cyamophila willieti]
MEVILCMECLDFYGDGLYKTDKKGDDVYCRWCAQGGTIYCCSKCSVAFCKKCIDRNLKTDKKVMTDINKDTWACFICISKPLWYLRALHWAVQKYKKDLLADPRKRKLSTSSIESGTPKTSRPGPASAKKALAGPASAKKAKLEEVVKKPGPASSKRPGPASLTKPSVIDLSDEDKPIQTRHKKIDYSPKIEFPIVDPPKRRSTQRKKATPVSKARNTKKGKKPVKKRKFLPDVSSDEEFDDFEDEEDDDSAGVEDEVKEPVERVMEQVLDFCFKLSNNFNTKLIKYGLYYKGNLTTSDKINSACSNLHMDLKKIVRLYNAIDEKMMNQLDEYNSAQQALEAEKLALEESVLGEIDCDAYGIDPKTPPEPEVIVAENDESEERDETMDESNPIDITAESEEPAEDEQRNKAVVDGEESQENNSDSKVNEETVENGIYANEEIIDKPASQEKESEEKEKETNGDETDHVTETEKSSGEAMDVEEVGNKPAPSDKNDNSADAISCDISEQTKDSEDSKNDVESITVESTSTENKEDDKTDIDDSMISEVDGGTSTENKEDDKTDIDDSMISEVDGGEIKDDNKDTLSGELEKEISKNGETEEGNTKVELDDNQVKDVNNDNSSHDIVESKDDIAVEKADNQKQNEPRELETGPVKNGEAEDSEKMEVDNINGPKDGRNGSSDKVDDADGLSDISDKSDSFNDFDKVATKEPIFPNPPAATHSN